VIFKVLYIHNLHTTG